MMSLGRSSSMTGDSRRLQACNMPTPDAKKTRAAPRQGPDPPLASAAGTDADRVSEVWTGLGRARPIVICLVLLALVAWAFLPALRNGFTNCDDPEYVTGNSHVRAGLTWPGVQWAFGTFEGGNWHPLTWLSHMLDCQIYGLTPWGHHLTSVLLHALSTLLLFLLLRQMTGATWRSLLVAALFGLHPLRVESVAWLAERKDVLSTLFFMLTLWAYAAYVAKSQVSSLKSPVSLKSQVSSLKSPVSLKSQVSSLKSRTSVGGSLDKSGSRELERLETEDLRLETGLWYPLALLFFALGLMSKPMLVTLPFVLLLLDYWPLRRNAECRVQSAEWGEAPAPVDPFKFKIKNLKLKIFLPLLREKLPFFLLAAAGSAVALVAQRSSGAVARLSRLPLLPRMENALVAYGRYLRKLFWPADLAVFYPHPVHWPLLTVLLAAALLVVVSLAVIALRRRHAYLLVGWLWFLGTLLPVIGLVQVGGQSMADRYSYIPSIGVLIMLAWGAYDATRRWRGRTVALAVVAGVVTLLCAGVTRRQIGYWQNGETLFRRALAVTQDNFVAYAGLGDYALSREARLDEAVRSFREAIRLHPRYPTAHAQLGQALLRQGQVDEAIAQLQESIGMNPNYPRPHLDLGNALCRKGRLDEGIKQLEEAIRLDPGSAEAHGSLGNALCRSGRVNEGIAHLEEAIRLEPGSFEGHYNLGMVLCGQGRLDDGIRQFEAAVKLQPKSAQAHCALGVALAGRGRRDEAVAELTRALQLQPNYPQAEKQLRDLVGASRP